MRYMMLIYLDENSLSEAERGKCYQESAAYARQLHDMGKCLAVSPLQPTFTATSVRFQEGKRVITDGPFAETREQLGGFFLVDAQNLDDAIDIASQIPAGKFGTVEVRPLVPILGLPSAAKSLTRT
jgi:hypothetical protein